MTNWNYWEAVRRFQRVLEVSGVSAQLIARGIKVRDEANDPGGWEQMMQQGLGAVGLRQVWL